MTLTIPISQFRQQLFTLTDKLMEEGGEITVLKDGKPSFIVKTMSDDAMKTQTKKVLKIMDNHNPELWKNYNPKAYFDRKVELEYFRKSGSWNTKAKRKKHAAPTS